MGIFLHLPFLRFIALLKIVIEPKAKLKPKIYINSVKILVLEFVNFCMPSYGFSMMASKKKPTNHNVMQKDAVKMP